MRAAALLVVVAACGGASQDATTPRQSKSALGVFMRTQLNAPFSTTSFHLFQADGSDPIALPAAATQLAEVAARLAEFPEPPGDSEQGRQVFYEYAAAMRNDAETLMRAVATNQRENAVRAFEEIRKKCDSCHHFFRYGE